jgi:hypothetical protein
MKKQRRHYAGRESRHPKCIRPRTPLSREDARRLLEGYVEHYNNVRLNSAIGYITPKDMLAAGSRRSTPGGIGSWEPRGNNGRFVASRPREKAKTLVSGRSGGRGRGGLHPDARPFVPNPIYC